MNSRFILLFSIYCLSLIHHELEALERDAYGLSYCKKHICSCVSACDDKVIDLAYLIPKYKQHCRGKYCSRCKHELNYIIIEQDNGNSSYELPLFYCPCLAQLCSDFKNKRITFESALSKTESHYKSAKCCRKNVIYSPYLRLEKYFSFFFAFLQYVETNPDCTCYWPELSKKAASISDIAYLRFKDLFNKTAFKSLLKQETPNDYAEHINFFVSNKDLSEHGMIINSTCQCLLFSHYYYVCKEFLEYSRTHHSVAEHQEVYRHLNDTLNILSKDFYQIYKKCLKHHTSNIITEEKFFLEACCDMYKD